MFKIWIRPLDCVSSQDTFLSAFENAREIACTSLLWEQRVMEVSRYS